MKELRNSVEIFAGAMEQTLSTKDDERGELGWLHPTNTTVGWLHERLIKESDELHEARRDCNETAVMDECVDIANFAMMIFDRVRVRRGQ